MQSDGASDSGPIVDGSEAWDGALKFDDAGVACPTATKGARLLLTGANIWAAPDTPAAAVAAMKMTATFGSEDWENGTAIASAYYTIVRNVSGCPAIDKAAILNTPTNLNAAAFSSGVGFYNPDFAALQERTASTFYLFTVGDPASDGLGGFAAPATFTIANGEIAIRGTPKPWISVVQGAYCAPEYATKYEAGGDYFEVAGPTQGPISGYRWRDTTREESWDCDPNGGPGPKTTKLSPPILSPTNQTKVSGPINVSVKRTSIGDVAIVWRDFVTASARCCAVCRPDVDVYVIRAAFFASLCGAETVRFLNAPTDYPYVMYWK